MIRLKSLLIEKTDKADLKVLFIGDAQTLQSNSYAKQLLKKSNIDGKIVAKPEASLNDIFIMLQDNMSDQYDVVSILGGDVDSKKEKYEASIERLKQIYLFVKKFNCILVAITTPTKDYSKDPEKYPSDDELSKWIETQSISDITINLGDLDNLDFRKNGILLDSDVNERIASEWYSDVMSNFPEIETADDEIAIELSTDNIKQIQQDLMSLGYFVGPDKDTGEFNEYTKTALKQFQRDSNLDVTGKFTDKTKTKLATTLNSTTKDDEWKLTNLVQPTIKPKRKKIASQTATADDIISFFVDKGLSEQGAAGIAGNLFIESGFKTDNVGDNGTSNGLAQWHNERWTGPNGFEQWCEQHGLDPWSVDGQLEFLWWELDSKYNSLKSYLESDSITPTAAAQRFAKQFERPAVISPERMRRAEQFYNEYTSFL